MNPPRSSFIGFSVAGSLGTALFLSSFLTHAQVAPLTDKLVGDAGGAVYLTQSVVRGKSTDTSFLPYGFIDYGRMFARVDTLGVKTVALGYGYLELAGRVSQDGWRANTPVLAGLTDRKTSIPLGIGTFQETPCGAFFSKRICRCQQIAWHLVGGYLRGSIPSR